MTSGVMDAKQPRTDFTVMPKREQMDDLISRQDVFNAVRKYSVKKGRTNE